MKKMRSQSQVQPTKPVPAEKTLQPKKPVPALFWLVLAVIPFLLLLLAEGALRLVGFGMDLPLFVPHPAHPAYLTARPDAVRRFVPTGVTPPNVTIEPQYFLAEKPATGVRIFVQGESSAAGYPYGLGASLAGLLEGRLRRSWPEHHVEVINTAMSAVNSYSMLSYADDIIAQQPDAVLIYAGHNEYVGILGVGAAESGLGSSTLTRLSLALRPYRLYQAVELLATTFTPEASVHNSDHNSAPQQKRTLMARLAQSQFIPLNSALYQAGLAQYQRNLAALLGKYQQAGVPVFLATVASNIADQQPFQSPPLTASQRQLLAELASSDPGNNPSNNAVKLAALRDIIDQQQHGLLAFELGQWLRAQQRFAEAKVYLELARDLDQLRFRAPGDINNIHRQLAAEYAATLVETEQALAQHSTGGLIGRELMLEHLHPNLPGYFVIADQFYQALANSKPQSVRQQQLPAMTLQESTAQAWTLRPVLPAEEYAAFARIATLTSDYPFVPSAQPVQLPKASDWQQQLGLDYFANTISWLTLMQQSLAQYQASADLPMQLKTSLILADAMPEQAGLQATAARLLQQQGRHGESQYYQQRCQRALPVAGRPVSCR
ncbi:SGNH/GDSL hydrolase family protein [Rheinheimera sp. SA_1]|uniref:SGNH/GDSL hydrolase family protein n=1 Tax=Rheinheimera sp. SA_1 TaxID=1827365 RepID=UPI000B01C7A6|nr:SGNH/GDSL hydrolase family protein [Rheinheimera sp. SA_1]